MFRRCMSFICSPWFGFTFGSILWPSGNPRVSSPYRKMTSTIPYLIPCRETGRLLHIRIPANISLHLGSFDCVCFTPEPTQVAMGHKPIRAHTWNLELDYSHPNHMTEENKFRSMDKGKRRRLMPGRSPINDHHKYEK